MAQFYNVSKVVTYSNTSDNASDVDKLFLKPYWLSFNILQLFKKFEILLLISFSDICEICGSKDIGL